MMPSFLKTSSTSLAFVKPSIASSTISGMPATDSTRCPREATVSFCAVAAIAENNANLASFFGMLLRIFFSALGG